MPHSIWVNVHNYEWMFLQSSSLVAMLTAHSVMDEIMKDEGQKVSQCVILQWELTECSNSTHWFPVTSVSRNYILTSRLHKGTLAIFKLCEYTVTTVIYVQRPWTVKMSKQHLTFIFLWVQDYIFKERRQILCKISHWQVWLAVWFLYQEVNKWSWSCLNWFMYCALVHKSLRLLQCSADVTKHCTMGLLFSTLLSVNFYVVNALNFLLRWATDIMTQSINQLKHDKVSRDLCCSSILSWSHHLETLQ